MLGKMQGGGWGGRKRTLYTVSGNVN
jgi:hypothetical protein